MKQKSQIALIYDRVNTPYGGAEKVLLSLHELFPDAPLYTSVYNPKKAPWADVFEIKTSFLNKIPILRNHHQMLAFLMPLAFESFDFNEYDLVISITSAEAKGVITKPETKHLCYLLTPPRYLYSHRNFYYKKNILFKIPIVKTIAIFLLNYLTRWDQMAIYRPDFIVPISQLVQKRIKQYYGLASQNPIYPTINTDSQKSSVKKESDHTNSSYVLMVTRLVPYKKIATAIKACQELDQPLIIVGTGTEHSSLKKRVTKPQIITFKGSVQKKELEALYQNCLAVLMPGEEDFGIVALESLSYQKPVIINANSGAAELIKDKKTGLLLKKADLQDIKSRILEVRKYDFKPAIMDRCVSIHNQAGFKKQFKKTVQKVLEKNTL